MLKDINVSHYWLMIDIYRSMYNVHSSQVYDFVFHFYLLPYEIYNNIICKLKSNFKSIINLYIHELNNVKKLCCVFKKKSLGKTNRGPRSAQTCFTNDLLAIPAIMFNLTLL